MSGTTISVVILLITLVRVMAHEALAVLIHILRGRDLSFLGWWGLELRVVRLFMFFGVAIKRLMRDDAGLVVVSGTGTGSLLNLLALIIKSGLGVAIIS